MTKRILICDDDYMFISVLREQLQLDGYEVIEARDGKKALAFLQSETFDLVITDMHMPHITGMEVLDIMRNELNLQTPVIVLTKDFSERTMENSYTMGAVDYIFKPIKPSIVSQKIKLILK